MPPSNREAMERIIGAVDRLPKGQRDAIKLWLLGHNHQEIARELDITIQASHMRIHRARKKLRQER